MHVAYVRVICKVVCKGSIVRRKERQGKGLRCKLVQDSLKSLLVCYRYIRAKVLTPAMAMPSYKH